LSAEANQCSDRYDKEDCERFESALKILRDAKRDLHRLAEDIYSELVAIMPETAKGSPSTTSSEEQNGHTATFMEAFKSATKEMLEKAKENDDVGLLISFSWSEPRLMPLHPQG